jgi:two-component system, cell cycle response regulator
MKTIVVVEDQQVLTAAYSNKFKSQGFHVEVATDGEAAVDLITRIKPDLVLLDLHLPKLNGLEVLKKVRSNPELESLPIIVFSNLTKPGAVEEAWQAGATLVLSKLNTSPNRVLESVLATMVAHPAPAAQEISARLRPVPSLVVPAATSSGKGNVLLVEAGADLRTVMAFLLGQAGHQVTAVSRNSDALEQIKTQSFEFFLLGRSAPENDDLSLCKRLRQAGLNRPIIMYSTTALFAAQQEGLRDGASAYLVKPEDILNVGQIISGLQTQQTKMPHVHAA